MEYMDTRRLTRLEHRGMVASRAYPYSLTVNFVLLLALFLGFAQATLAAAPSVVPLNHRVVDAEYSKSLDRIVTVAATPFKALHIIDPLTNGDVSVDLPMAPSSVSVSPDGLFAAVGHNGWISYVDLSQPQLIKSLAVTADVLDVVLAGNGWVYAFPRIDQWQQIHGIELATGNESLSTGMSIYAGTRAKLHPGGTAIYGANNGLSPSDIEKYDISGGNAAYLRDSPYHGDYAMCGNLWMSEDGLRIFTACGNVFRASDLSAEDMIYNGALQGLGNITSLSHSSAASKVAAIPATGYFADPGAPTDSQLWLFSDEFLSLQSTLTLPTMAAGGNDFASHGRFVFFNADGSRYSVIVQADPSSGALLDYGVYTVSPSSSSHTIEATSGNGGTIAPSGNVAALQGETLRFTMVPDTGYEIADVLVDGVSVGKLASYSFNNIGASHTIQALFAAAAPQPVKPLNHRVVDAEYSKALDRIVTVSTTPANRLYLVDPADGRSQGIDLSAAPTSVSVAPDGLHAAVGHNGWISYVDLAPLAVNKVWPVIADVFDIVLAGNGWAHAFPRIDQWVAIHSVNVLTGEEATSGGWSIRAGTRAALHPGGTSMYGANNGLSPSDIEKYDISGGPAVYLRDSPYHGDYAMCGNLWVSEDGLRIFTACGNVFRASDVLAEDMTYNGALEGLGSVASLSHSSAASKVAAIPASGYFGGTGGLATDSEIWLFEYQFLQRQAKILIPPMVLGGQAASTHGRFIFFNGDGSRYSAIVQADPSANALFDFGVYSIDANAAIYTIEASAGTGGTITPTGTTNVVAGQSPQYTIQAEPGYQIADVVVDGISRGPVSTYTFDLIAGNHTISASFASSIQYAISAYAGVGGSVSPSGEVMVSAGSSQTFSFTPSSGFRIASVWVDGIDVGVLESYTFDAVWSGHSLTVLFSPVDGGGNGDFSNLPYFGLEIGSHKTFVVPRLALAGTLTRSVSQATDFAEPTVAVTSEISGRGLVGTDYFQVLPDGVGIVRVNTLGRTVAFSEPLLVLRSSMEPGNQWSSTATTQIAGLDLDVRLDVSVSQARLIRTPAGRFMATPVTYRLSMAHAASGRSKRSRWTEYFVPNVGVIKQTNSPFVLASFSANNGTVDTPPPVITKTSFSGDKLIVRGYQFGTTPEGKSLIVGTTPVGTIKSWSPRKIVAQLPAGVERGEVKLSTAQWNISSQGAALTHRH